MFALFRKKFKPGDKVLVKDWDGVETQGKVITTPSGSLWSHGLYGVALVTGESYLYSPKDMKRYGKA